MGPRRPSLAPISKDLPIRFESQISTSEPIPTPYSNLQYPKFDCGPFLLKPLGPTACYCELTAVHPCLDHIDFHGLTSAPHRSIRNPSGWAIHTEDPLSRATDTRLKSATRIGPNNLQYRPVLSRRGPPYPLCRDCNVCDSLSTQYIRPNQANGGD